VQSLEPLLRDHPYFAGLEPQYLALLVGCARNVRFGAGEYLFEEGQPADRFYILRSGHVALEIDAPGRGPIIVQTVGAGDVLGFSWLFEPHRWSFDARAVEATRAIALDGVCLRTKSEADHGLGYELMKRFARVVVQRLQATRLQLLDVYGHAGR
jgi:CRP/FNR family cyclic AMP-dependent transcriptional regulator